MSSGSESHGVWSGTAPRVEAGLFVVSAIVLALQILQTRIFAYSLSHVTIFLAIGVCLLGLGASATVLAALPEVTKDRARRLAAAAAAAGALCVPVAHAVFARTATSLSETSFVSLLTLVVLTLPYFGFGMAIALLLVCRSEAIGRAYAFNLAGSGIGCLIVFPLLDGLGAESALVVVAGLGLLAALVIHLPDAWPSRAAIGAVAGVLVVAQVGSDRLFEFPAEPQGHYDLIRKWRTAILEQRPGARFDLPHLHSRWDRTGRIDVYGFDTSIPALRARVGAPIETLLIVQDSSAGSFLLGVGDDLSRARDLFEKTIYGVGYSLGPRSDVLVLGLGGGPDVLSALYHGAKHVVGAEINEIMISAVRDDFGDFQGNPYTRPGVDIHRIDGRTFLESTDETFDLIQMTSVDTKTMIASGALALTNNYLYTEEALAAMVGRLREDGILSITRFGDVHGYRLIATAVEGLRAVGARDVARHIMVVRQGPWHTALVKRSPFESDEVERLHAWVGERRGPVRVVVPALEGIHGQFRWPMKVVYTPPPSGVTGAPFFRALARGQLDAFIASYPIDISPSTDDWPYFFFTDRVDSLLEEMPPLLSTLFGFALRTALVAAIFILAPLLAMQRRVLRAPGALRTLAYFSCLGLGFMLIEIGLMSRFVLFLGHQSYAVTVVLFGILVGASLGSATSSLVPIRTALPTRLIVAGIAVGVVAYASALGPLFSGALELSFTARLAVALGLLIPLGFVLGFPFPLGLRALRETGLSPVAWAIGVNGLASVVGSMIAVPVSMITGLRLVLWVGAGLYALAVLVVPNAPQRSPGLEA